MPMWVDFKLPVKPRLAFFTLSRIFPISSIPQFHRRH